MASPHNPHHPFIEYAFHKANAPELMLWSMLSEILRGDFW